MPGLSNQLQFAWKQMVSVQRECHLLRRNVLCGAADRVDL